MNAAAGAETSAAVLHVGLAVAIVAGAAVALWARDESRTIGWYVGFGLALAAASLWLGAPGVAGAEALVGAAATGWLLWRVSSGTDPVETESVRTGD